MLSCLSPRQAAEPEKGCRPESAHDGRFCQVVKAAEIGANAPTVVGEPRFICADFGAFPEPPEEAHGCKQYLGMKCNSKLPLLFSIDIGSRHYH